MPDLAVDNELVFEMSKKIRIFATFDINDLASNVLTGGNVHALPYTAKRARVKELHKFICPDRLNRHLVESLLDRTKLKKNRIFLTTVCLQKLLITIKIDRYYCNGLFE